EAATIGLMTLELDGRVREANHAAERALGYPAGALATTALWDELPSTAAALADGLNDRCELEHPLRRRDATLRWFRPVLVLVRDDTGQPDHLTMMLEDIDARKRAEAELIHRSNHDALTSLPRREYFVERLADALAQASHTNSGVGVVFVDVDNFKHVNDSAGH